MVCPQTKKCAALRIFTGNLTEPCELTSVTFCLVQDAVLSLILLFPKFDASWIRKLTFLRPTAVTVPRPETVYSRPEVKFTSKLVWYAQILTSLKKYKHMMLEETAVVFIERMKKIYKT